MPPGRKSHYDTRIQPRLAEIAAWCRDGYTDRMICEALSISIPTFYKWKALKQELVDALKVNKAIADLTVENSLYKKAVGYSTKETTREIKTDAKGNTIAKHVKEVEKEIAPDSTACIFWLKNRRRTEWRDKVEKLPEAPNNKNDLLEQLAEILPD